MAAFQWQRRFLMTISRHNRIITRYPHFTTPLQNPIKISQSTNNLDETYVLDQLSDLLPIQRKPPQILNLYHDPSEDSSSSSQLKPPEIKSAADHFLAPEDKLRGVFLQKIVGRTAIEHALSSVGVDLDVDLFGKVVNRGNLSGDAMIILFNWAIKQQSFDKDVVSYNVLVKALGRRKFLKFVMDVLIDMNVQGVCPNYETLGIAMDSFIRAHHVSKAIQLLGNLEEIGMTRDTESLNVLLQCLCKRSHVKSASSVLNSMKGKIPFNVMTYNLVISGWSTFGNVVEIENILRSMVLDGFKPDCLSFSYLLEGLGRANRIDDAVRIFDSMEEQDCVQDSSNYNAMISNFISIKDFDECMKYYDCMLKSNVEPDIDTYTKLITAFIKARKVADSLEMLDEMFSRGIIPKTGTITSFIEPLCSFGPPHAAMMIYKKARKAGCGISLSAYKLLLMRLSRFGKCGMILSVWDEMQESGFSADMEVYEYVINGLCNIGQLDNAIAVMEESVRKGFCPSRLIYTKLRNKLLAFNKVEVAYRLFLKIKGARQAENARKYWRYNGWHF